MSGNGEIDRLMREAMQRGKAAERAKGLAALSLILREYPDNLVAFLWLARCLSRPDVKIARTPAPGSTSRPTS